MPREVYRYAFRDHIPFDDVLATVDLAVIAVQSLHGEERTRLDARFASDPKRRTLAIDAVTPVGQALNQLFVGYARREFGDAAFKVIRRPGDPPRRAAKSPCDCPAA
jgi:hypothetical protein